MRKTSSLGPAFHAVAAALALVCACSSSGSGAPVTSGTPMNDSGLPDTSVDDGETDSEATDAGPDTGADGDATTEGDGNTGHDSGTGVLIDGAGDVFIHPVSPTDAADATTTFLCPTGHAWTAGAAILSQSIDRFGGVALTGLTAVWTLPSGDPVAADRTTTSAPFSTLSVLLPAPPAGNRAGLDSTGTVVLAAPERGSALIWQRSDAQQPWQLSTSTTTPFDPIFNAVALLNATWSEPAFGASGDRLFYMATPASGAPVMYESTWDSANSNWAAGTPLTETELASVDATHLRRPTGASADDLTLFYFDEVAGVESAAWRVSTTQPFSHFETIPVAPEAAPSADCTTLYFESGEQDGGEDGGAVGTGISIAQ
jgi:hypothetical protein